ncbi:AtpZ/AtpI family protein [Primorskyibacter sedentarius]|uniref:ATP synthase protein I n=1 Tax=Primorskyibacter sedentarius TaxID=745311 RepID=A0A4R3JE02_9RHOB|nr:AtpZ/AtpI family protein [Primorskyibacter sedentarius]TCS63326.1 ATP synthase protein I [Primorskyibacter sedentarius]
MSPDPDKSAEHIARQAKRMKSSRDHPGPSPLRGIGTFGMIGWSIAVPTVGGAFLGQWLDRVAPQRFSWTIALILGGVVIGVFIAAAWVNKEGGEK